jgi:hypothetical protein
MGSKIWITWHFQARSRNLAKVLNLEIKEYFQNKNVLIRHLFSSIWTIKILVKNKPSVIFIQYSYLLLLLLYVYKILKRRNLILVVDCHTKALRRKATGIFNYIFWPLKKLSFEAADLSIISNEGLAKDIKKLHNNFIILPDMIPQIESINSKSSFRGDYCVYISSFAVDEPFADYLKVDEYYNLIGNAKCLIALTTEEDCLQSGAYEAISVEVPVVISDTYSLKQFFGSAAVYTNNDSNSIYNAILNAINMKEILRSEMQKLKVRRNVEFEQKIEKILKFVNSR